MINILKRSVLFEGLTEYEVNKIIDEGNIFLKEFLKNEHIINMGDEVIFFGFLISGVVQVSTQDISGNRMIMANIEPGETFGESLAYTGTKSSPVYVAAAAESKILLFDINYIKQCFASREEHLQRFGINFTKLLAGKALSMNSRIQILSKKSIHDKVIAFLTFMGGVKNKNIKIPFSRNEMADYLGVDRSALSRELSRMAEEGKIDFHKNVFRMLDDE